MSNPPFDEKVPGDGVSEARIGFAKSCSEDSKIVLAIDIVSYNVSIVRPVFATGNVDVEKFRLR
ncbi:hypothetical protein OVY01_16575 [Robbsia sp. Bb-Pol-6]|uniref:Uncharacterized protein n=1 Tax=Robbsia betulipollinis TaxID=2981849 RepID=A0ABT3ZQF8_9BURK|nr:hypothetical protein [Robbsia betulipollinis]MCY0388791.1 hypothetical protein [Robbsia betulipollinis]